MVRFSLLVAVAIGTALVTAGPGYAHHSFAMFAQDRTATVSAVVTEFQWSNPHSWVEVDIPDGDEAHNRHAHLALEMSGPSSLRSGGWNARTLKAGDRITISYHPMRDGSAAGQLLSVKFADGRVLKSQ